MKAFRSLFSLAILLLGILGSVGATAQEPIDLRDFRNKYESNDALGPEDFEIFPLHMQRYLYSKNDRWENGDLSGFSRRVWGRYYIFVVKRDKDLARESRAVLVPLFRRQIATREDWNWQRVFLPSILAKGRVEATNWIPGAQWSDKDDALVSNYCTDIFGPDIKYDCARSYFRVHPRSVALLRIELKEIRSQKWVTAWGDGGWKIDPWQ